MCASTNHQMRAKSIGTPYTTHVQFIPAASRSDPVLEGNIKIGTIRMTKAHAVAPIGVLNFPKFHGPGRNLLPTRKTLIKIGIVKATKAATAPIEKSAPTARAPPNIKKVMRIPMPTFHQTALTGVLVLVFTCEIHPENGKQPSRAYAKVTRDAATMFP